jgi:hypothetical protein
MRYKLVLEAQFDCDAELPQEVKFGEKAIDAFVAKLEECAPQGPTNAPFMKMSLEKVETT